MSLVEMLKGKVHFQFYRKGELFYKTDCGFEFRVPCADCGDGIFLNEDKAMLFMRYIKKEIQESETYKEMGIK